MTVNPTDPRARRTIYKQWNDYVMAGFSIHLIGRWPDENYCPLPIPINHHETERHFIITAKVPGVESPNLEVEILHNCLIILARGKEGTSDGEQYSEFPLPGRRTPKKLHLYIKRPLDPAEPGVKAVVCDDANILNRTGLGVPGQSVTGTERS